MRASPPVAVLLIVAPSPFQPGPEIVASRAGFLGLGVVARPPLAGGIRGEPTLNHRRLGVGRGGDKAERGDHEQACQRDPRRLQPLRRASSGGCRRLCERPHPAKIIAHCGASFAANAGLPLFGKSTLAKLGSQAPSWPRKRAFLRDMAIEGRLGITSRLCGRGRTARGPSPAGRRLETGHADPLRL